MNIELIITIVIIMISFVGWIVNYVNEKAREQQHRRAAPRDRGGNEFQHEIDQFLEQVGGKRPQPQQQPQRYDDIEIEVVPDDERYDREQAARRHRSISSLEDHHVESSHLGEGIRASVSEHLDVGKVGETVVSSHIDDDLEIEYGDVKSSDDGTGSKQKGIEPNEIVQALRDPASVRRAIVINEVLTRYRPRR